jgi:hypothetical protein
MTIYKQKEKREIKEGKYQIITIRAVAYSTSQNEKTKYVAKIIKRGDMVTPHLTIFQLQHVGRKLLIIS